MEKNLEHIYKRFPARLRTLRIKNNFKLKHVSQKTGLHVSTINNFENGKKIPSLEAAIKLAEFFDVNISYLLGISNDPYFDRSIKVCIGIENFRRNLNYTQNEFAKLLEMPVADYEKIEDGLLPDQEMLLKISVSTGMDLKDITGLSRDELDDCYKYISAQKFAMNKDNIDYILLAMKIKQQGLLPDVKDGLL